MSTYDLYIKHTDVNGKSHIQEHRIWDGARFVSSLQVACVKANMELPKDAPLLARVQQVTREDYITSRRK